MYMTPVYGCHVARVEICQTSPSELSFWFSRTFFYQSKSLSYLNILAKVVSIFLKSGLFSGSSSQQLSTRRYTQVCTIQYRTTLDILVSVMKTKIVLPHHIILSNPNCLQRLCCNNIQPSSHHFHNSISHSLEDQVPLLIFASSGRHALSRCNGLLLVTYSRQEFIVELVLLMSSFNPVFPLPWKI